MLNKTQVSYYELLLRGTVMYVTQMFSFPTFYQKGGVTKFGLWVSLDTDNSCHGPIVPSGSDQPGSRLIAPPGALTGLA